MWNKFSLSRNTKLAAKTVRTGTEIPVMEAKKGFTCFKPIVPTKIPAKIAIAIIAVLLMVRSWVAVCVFVGFTINNAIKVATNTVISCVLIMASGGNLFKLSH